ncbi:MAG: helix-turn-helix transcriptional regulator, partial [bacterium]
MQNENMQTVGAYLKKNRELRGISLEEIASSTKININILSYLEADRFEKLPAPVFVKGFIKTYLGYLGVDPKEAVLFYDLLTDGHKQAESKINTLTEKGVCEPKERINKRVLIGAVTISVVFASLLTYYLATSKPSDRSKNKMIVKMLPGGQQIPLQPQGITLTPAANEPGKAQQPVVATPAPVAPAPVATATVVA